MGIPILGYHQIMPWAQTVPPAKSGLVVPELRFRQQMLFLRVLGYRSITVSQIAKKNPSHRRTIAITFDDGYSGIHEYALPILSTYGYNATFYVIAEDFIQPPCVERAFPILKEKQVQALLESGWELGSHSVSHPRLTSLLQLNSHMEVSESRSILERRFGKKVLSFSYPYGDFNSSIKQTVQREGYSCAVGVERLPGYEVDLFSLPRIAVGYDQSLSIFLWRLWRFYGRLRR